jgi:hypothetical protein
MRWIRPKWSLMWLAMFGIGTALPSLTPAEADEEPSPAGVRLLQVPDGGIQPQAVVDDRGVTHLIFFKGDPAGGDLFYARLDPGAKRFAPPVRANSQPGSAIAIGTIRGGQIAVGRGGRVHVAWNGSNGARPRNPAGSNPMLYTRSDPAGKAFESQRNLMQKTSALDGGGTIAADREGNVYVAWHGRTEDDGPGEAHRRMWVARSKDDGATFTAEEPAIHRETGACGCCGTRALAGRDGTVYLLYRAATDGVDRDMYLLHSEDHVARFDGVSISPWRTDGCPMSSASMADSELGVLAAWETKGEIFFTRIDPRTHRASPPIAPPGGKGNRKHPAVAGNARGDVILAWAEDTGWQKGGSLAWQVFDRAGKPIGIEGRIKAGVPVWGLGTVVAQPDGAFAIIHSGIGGAHAAVPPRDPMLGLAASILHPRVARLARELGEARDLDKAAEVARELLRLGSGTALDVVAEYAARTPLTAFDREHRILLLFDGSGGWIHNAFGVDIAPEVPPGTTPAEVRAMEREMRSIFRTEKLRTSVQIGKPSVLWSAVRRLPDGALAVDGGGAGDVVSFIARSADAREYYRFTFAFRDGLLDFGRSSTADVKDAQLRRWQASDWWPKEWR